MARAILGPIVNAGVHFTQMYGANPNDYKQYGFNGHEGLDIVSAEGVIIMSATDGRVIFAGDSKTNYGNYVTVYDDVQNVLTGYAHLEKVSVKKGDYVYKGQEIGKMGNTGRSTGPHLHFNIMRTEPQKTAGNALTGTVTVISPKPLNPNNGYKGWENPLDDSLFDWPGGPGIGDYPPASAGAPAETENNKENTTKTTFDEVYAKYYAGWGKEAAEQDWIKTMGQDLNKLLTARGISTDTKKKTVKQRPAALLKEYKLNPIYGNQSLKKLTEGGLQLGRVDLLAQFLGLQPEDNLQPGQILHLEGFPTDYYPASSEWLGILKLTSKDAVKYPGDWYLNPEYDGMNLKDIRNKSDGPFRSDILAGFLGISDSMPISKYSGFGTQNFPPSYIPNSGEWIGFQRIFSKNKPQMPEETTTPEQTPEETDTTTQYPPGLGSISITSYPDRAKIYIDGLYYKDLTPSNKNYLIPAGIHEVRLEKSGYKEYAENAEVNEGENTEVNATLEPTTPTTTTHQTATQTQTQNTELGTAIALEAITQRLTQIERILTDKGLM